VEQQIARIVAKMKKGSPAAHKQPLGQPLPPGKLEPPAKRSKDEQGEQAGRFL
jgi:hypothetical protein